MATSPGTSPTGTTKTNGLAIASLVLGIIGLLISLFGIIPILAIIFGVMARGQIARGQGSGQGLATAGLVLGIIGLVLFIIVIIAVGLNPTVFSHS